MGLAAGTLVGAEVLVQLDGLAAVGSAKVIGVLFGAGPAVEGQD